MEVVFIAFMLFIVLIIVFIPFDRIIPKKNLHKLIIFLNERSYKVAEINQKRLLDRILTLSERIYKLLNIKLKSSRYASYKDKLISAGLGDKANVEKFFGVKILTCILVFCYYFLMFLISPTEMLFLLLLCGIAIAYFLPDSIINVKIKRRNLQIQVELPSVLNSLAIVTSAGLGLMDAIRMLCEVRRGTLVDELKKVLEEINMGVMQKESLLHLSEKCQVNEITIFVFTLTQSFEKGASGITLVLNDLAKEAWENRKNKAKEAGQKASIKLFFSMMLLVLPSLMIFLLGPALFSIFTFMGNQ